MGKNLYLGVSGVFFALTAVLHLLRVINSWPAEINNAVVPVWVSWIGVIVAGILALSAFSLMRKR